MDSFNKLRQKLGTINPETLSGVLEGKVKLTEDEQKEFDLFMEQVKAMFAPKK